MRPPGATALRAPQGRGRLQRSQRAALTPARAAAQAISATKAKPSSLRREDFLERFTFFLTGGVQTRLLACPSQVSIKPVQHFPDEIVPDFRKCDAMPRVKNDVTLVRGGGGQSLEHRLLRH